MKVISKFHQTKVSCAFITAHTLTVWSDFVNQNNSSKPHHVLLFPVFFTQCWSVTCRTVSSQFPKVLRRWQNCVWVCWWLLNHWWLYYGPIRLLEAAVSFLKMSQFLIASSFFHLGKKKEKREKPEKRASLTVFIYLMAIFCHHRLHLHDVISVHYLPITKPCNRKCCHIWTLMFVDLSWWKVVDFFSNCTVYFIYFIYITFWVVDLWPLPLHRVSAALRAVER